MFFDYKIDELVENMYLCKQKNIYRKYGNTY